MIQNAPNNSRSVCSRPSPTVQLFPTNSFYPSRGRTSNSGRFPGKMHRSLGSQPISRSSCRIKPKAKRACMLFIRPCNEEPACAERRSAQEEQETQSLEPFFQKRTPPKQERGSSRDPCFHNRFPKTTPRYSCRWWLRQNKDTLKTGIGIVLMFKQLPEPILCFCAAFCAFFTRQLPAGMRKAALWTLRVRIHIEPSSKAVRSHMTRSSSREVRISWYQRFLGLVYLSGGTLPKTRGKRALLANLHDHLKPLFGCNHGASTFFFSTWPSRRKKFASANLFAGTLLGDQFDFRRGAPLAARAIAIPRLRHRI